jgi:hypothetical protein
LIEDLESRTMAYRQIAVAQAGAGDRAGAESTLRAALDDVSKDENRELRRVTLPVIVTGQAEAGLDGDLAVTAEMIDPSERVGTYISVAAFKVKAGQTEEAAKYYGKAIEHAAGISDPMSRASNLATISGSQADAGLIDAAKATAEMIEIDGYKESALSHISLILDGTLKTSR